ncbi:septal ring lytic transglycosylase RlpA family protein [Parasaccharibacter apium]|uniref:septal ring lytic transglycosylase RlpA family protein n=1 Tax=Parasaccharibacter apium TaxID=1510841 RepID=UPI0012EC618A|nr:septal ring lytic transglycosylase RlpA family protein [Parasaccharibacter apium]
MKAHTPFPASMEAVVPHGRNRRFPFTTSTLPGLIILACLGHIASSPSALAAGMSSDVEKTEEAALPPTQSGLASWYGGKKLIGKRTASGERFSPDALTAAHPSLPLGTKLLVHSSVTGRSVIVRVNDRGPADSDRIIDLSQGAAASLGIMNHGVSHITITVLPRRRSRFRHPTDMHEILQDQTRQAEKIAQDSPLR